MEPFEILQNSHTFIHSAYYFENSKSLGKNAIAIVTTMNKRTANRILDLPIRIVASNSSVIMKTQANLTTEHRLEDRCDYSMILIQANTLNNLTKLEIESLGETVQIPVKQPLKTAPKQVVFCVSPQFAAEQWQVFLAQVHISKFYGAHLHIYVVSMIEAYFNLLLEYQKLGLISIEPWLTIKFSKVNTPVMEPNRNVELRAQTAAHTDCLLMYKEAATFIGSIDMDDLLIPLQSHSSYYEEFEKFYDGNRFISALNYNKNDFEVSKTVSIKELIKSAEPLNSTDSGKSFVRSERYNSTWAHWSRVADTVTQYDADGNKYKTHLEKLTSNGIFHLRKINTGNFTGSGKIPINPGNEELLISMESLNSIEDDLKKHMEMPKIQKIIKSLPTEDFYGPIIFKCYNESFYHARDIGKLSQHFVCINAYDCEIPQRDDLPCIHSDANYTSGPFMIPITYHYATQPFFSTKIGCLQ